MSSGKWIKNNDTVNHTWSGQTVTPGNYHEIDSLKLGKFSQDSQLIADLGTTKALMAKDDSGNTDITDVNQKINFLKGLGPVDSNGYPILAPTFEYDEDLTQNWVGHKYVATKNVLNIYDEVMAGDIKLRGGWFQLLNDPSSPKAVIGDYVEFSVVDKDDVIGLFSTYSLTPRTDEIQRIIFSAVPTAGTYTLTHSGNTTSAINYDADAAAVQTALRALSSLTDVTVTGNTTDDFVVTFTGADGYADQPELTSDDGSLTGATISHSTTTQGYEGDILELNKYVKKQYINPYDFNRQEFNSFATSIIVAGLFTRFYYFSAGTVDDVDVAMSLTCYPGA